MPELLIRLKRHPDRTASLTCIRRDGSRTWQRQRGQIGLVFPPHDLTHYAVEATLGFRHGFYGLIADGWDISDFARPWRRGPIPAEAQTVELIVGFFDAERRNGSSWTESEFNDHARRYVAARRASRSGAGVQVPALTAAQLERVRASRAELLRQWSVIGAGECMELEFQRGGP